MPPKAIDIEILHIKDHHLYIQEDDFYFDVSKLTLAAKGDAGKPIQEVPVSYSGFPMLVDVFNSEAAKSRNVLKLHAGDACLAKFLDFLKAGNCSTPVLAADVLPASDSAIASGFIKPFTIKEMDGKKIGIIGVDIAGKTKNSSNPDKGTVFQDKTKADKSLDKLPLAEYSTKNHTGRDNCNHSTSTSCVSY